MWVKKTETRDVMLTPSEQTAPKMPRAGGVSLLSALQGPAFPS